MFRRGFRERKNGDCLLTHNPHFRAVELKKGALSVVIRKNPGKLSSAVTGIQFLFFTSWQISLIHRYKHTCILGRTYVVECSIHLIEEHSLLIITGVQASGVIIDRLLRQCCFVWSEIVGSHSSANFND